MKIPLRFGLPLLLILWVASGVLDDTRLALVLRVGAIGAALWTAFSLPIPSKRPPAAGDDSPGPAADADGGEEEQEQAQPTPADTGAPPHPEPPDKPRR